MLPIENYTIAVFEKYAMYYVGLSSAITEKFGDDLRIVHCPTVDLSIPTIIEYPVDLILFHVPLFMPFRAVKQLVKKIKERHHEAGIILYSAENRNDLEKNVDALDIKGAFLLSDSPEDIMHEIGKIVDKKGESNVLIKMD